MEGAGRFGSAGWRGGFKSKKPTKPDEARPEAKGIISRRLFE